MQTLLTPDQMRAMEARYMDESGTPAAALMERAAQGVVEALADMLGGLSGKTAVFACGPGNNAGDGYAAARLFAQRGGQAIALALYPPERLRGDALENARRLRALKNVYLAAPDRLDDMPRPDAWVDALFGIGLSREIEARDRRILRRMEEDRLRGAKVLAVDIPSGLDGESGRILGAAAHADRTVTFEEKKTGHVLMDGPEYCGEIAVVPLGIPDADRPRRAARLVEEADIAFTKAPRRKNTHKGDYGHLLLVAGSFGMAGAAAFAAQAALRAGAGLVSVACPRSIVPILQTLVPGAMCLPLEEENGAVAEAALPTLQQALRGKSALAVGPGLSTRACAAAVRLALESELPMVLDADGLNLTPHGSPLQALWHKNLVVTPHPGEAARLLGRAADRPVEAAHALRDLGCGAALLKGAASVICGEHLTVSASGSPGMAKGGSGDVLTGVVGALLARGFEPETAAWAASEWHGRAGERAAILKGETGMGATDIVEQL